MDCQRSDSPPGGVRGLTVAVSEPDKIARRWAEVIGIELRDGNVLRLDDGAQEIRFVDSDGKGDRFVAVDVEVPDRSGRIDIAGVTFNRAVPEARKTTTDIGGSTA